MEIFNVINSKAQGLSTKPAGLSRFASCCRPCERAAGAVHRDSPEKQYQSPWFRQVSLGGGNFGHDAPRIAADIANGGEALPRADQDPGAPSRRMSSHRWSWISGLPLPPSARISGTIHESTLLCKGVGVYALMGIAGDLIDEAGSATIDKSYFSNKLADFILGHGLEQQRNVSGLGGEAELRPH